MLCNSNSFSYSVAMEAKAGPPLPAGRPPEPNIEKIKQKLLKNGVYPTPKIIHTLRKKELQKFNRRLAKEAAKQPQPLTDAQKQEIEEEAHFQAIKSEFRSFNASMNVSGSMIGKPWERLERHKLLKLANESKEYSGDMLKTVHLRELSDIIEKEREEFGWLLDDDIELEEDWLQDEKRSWAPPKRSEADAIRFLVDRLSGTELTLKDHKFSKLMRLSGLQFTEVQLLKIVEGLGDRGQWKHALSVVDWIYNTKEHKYYKSRFVYTKLLAILGKLRRPREAHNIFNLMRASCQIYPDMAAYRSIAVTLGQAGLLKELLNVIEGMKQKPARKIKKMSYKNWDPILQPDVVVFNSVLNACVPNQQWRGVYWVFERLRKNGLKPNAATFGLAMEVMLQSGKYHLVHEFFMKMKKNGEVPKALTYKVLVKAFWEEGKVNEAVQAVRDMEQRGVIGTPAVYYELACCLCYNGKWQEAIIEIEKLKKVPRTKPLQVTFTGMILSSMNGGHFDDCESIFEHSKYNCAPDIGIINAMLKVYGRNDMFSKAKELFEEIKRVNFGFYGDISSFISPDAHTYSLMLVVSSSALQWEYFEYVYKEMTLSGYHLDQTKHAFLLVEASKAGKWHLLEHAFDKILEVGEIPHPLFFTELICQALARGDYEKAFAIINSMAYAPFQVSKQQWENLFLESGDRISMVNLKELHNMMCNRDLAMEISISSLSATLQSLCGSGGSEASSDTVTSENGNKGELLLDSSNCGVCRDESTNEDDLHQNSVILSCEHLQVNKGYTANSFSVNRANHTREENANSMLESGFTNFGCGDHRASGQVDIEFPADAALEHFLDCSDIGTEHIDQLEAILPNRKVDEYDGPNLPSAYEILDTWKENQRKDRIFFSF